ncbi:MAG: transcriptional repressor LexA [Lactobacillaceae bacterium]|jgi:repressor LexA|nr:transcriptional repressor LexA [Lactobacillaceae bacterium]
MSQTNQTEILKFIYDTQIESGYSPTIREIGEKFGLHSTATVHGYLDRLKKKDYIIQDPDKKRSVIVTEAGLEMIGVNKNAGRIPMIGVVTAGMPILAVEQETEDFFPLPENLNPYDGELFMLTVSGNSMINIGILDGDKIIVRKQNSANNGEVVVAMTQDFGGDSEATVKRFFIEDGHYRLQPENDAMDPIIVNEVSIIGLVVGLYRDQIF